MLDIRMPIAAMFTALGALLTVYGLITFTNKEMYERSLGVNMNLWWGLVMIAFGAIMYWIARRGKATMHSADDSVEGRRTEEREHESGMERKDRPRH